MRAVIDAYHATCARITRTYDASHLRDSKVARLAAWSLDGRHFFGRQGRSGAP
jgi:hypothetical protein